MKSFDLQGQRVARAKFHPSGRFIGATWLVLHFTVLHPSLS